MAGKKKVDLEKLYDEVTDEFLKLNGFGEPEVVEEEGEPEPEFHEAEEQEKKKKMPKTHKLYSALFGWDPKLGDKKDLDFPVLCFDREKDWSEEDCFYIPDLVQFEDRVIDHKVMYPFVLGMQADEGELPDKIMLVGPTGSGKSTLVEYYCAKINQPFFRINGRQDMESDSIIGRPWVEDGSMTFHKGEIPKAMEAGWLVLFDEPWKMPSGIWMTLQRMMEKGGILQLDDMPGELKNKQIVPNPRHRMVLADNVVGTGDNTDKYGATLIQDSSTLNRIDMVLEVGYLPEDAEVNLVMKKYKNIPKKSAERMIRVLNLLRKGFDQGELSSPASLRNVDAWGKKATQVKSYSLAFQWVLLKRYSEESEQAAVRDFYYTVFGDRI